MMYENAYANDFKDLEDLNLFRKKEQTLIVLINSNWLQHASWAYIETKEKNELKYNNNG